MSDTAITTTEAPVITTEAPVQTAPETPTTTETPVVTTEKAPETPAPTIEQLLEGVKLSEMSDEQLADIQSGDRDRIAAVLGVKKEPEGAPAASKTPEAPKEAQKDAQQPAKGGEHELGRVSIKALKPESRTKFMEALQLVRDGKHSDIAPAIMEVFGVQAPAQPAAQTPTATTEPEATAQPAVAPEIKAIEDRIATLEQERREAKEAYDYETAEQKLAELSDAKIELRFAKVEAEKRAAQEAVLAQEAAAWEQKESESRARALDKYGEQMSDTESSFAEYVEAEIVLAERRKDNILSQPDWPEKIADRVQEKYFNGRGTAQSAPPAQQIPPPPKGVRFPGSPVPNSAGTNAMTAQAAGAELAKMSPEERFAALELAQQRAEQRRS